MSDLEWGVPTQRKAKTEKFDTPVLTMCKLEGKGTGRKFTFNKAAIEALGIDPETDQTAMIGFGKGENNKEIFVKVINGENDAGYRLTKTATFSNKRVFEYITDLRELSNDQENELHLVESEVSGALEVASINSRLIESSTTQEVSEYGPEEIEETQEVDSVSEDAEVLDEATTVDQETVTEEDSMTTPGSTEEEEW